MSKYEPLEQFLRAGAAKPITLSLAQVDAIIGSRLPASAQKYEWWWANNDASHRQSAAWGRAGFSAHPHLAEGFITFTPVPSPAAHSS